MACVPTAGVRSLPRIMQAYLARHPHTDRILGVHIIGPRAGDLSAEAAVATLARKSAGAVPESSGPFWFATDLAQREKT